MNSENVKFFKSVIQTLQKLQITTMVAVFEKIQRFNTDNYKQTNSKINFYIYLKKFFSSSKLDSVDFLSLEDAFHG